MQRLELREREMKAIILGKFSSYMEMTRKVPHGSVLVPVMFLVYVNYTNNTTGRESCLCLQTGPKIQIPVEN